MSPTLTPDQVQKARVMRAAGATYAVLAAEFGVSISGIHYRLDPHIPDRPKRHHVTAEQIERIRELRAAGVPINEVCARFRISPSTVGYYTTSREPKPEPLRPPTRDELLLSAFPWAYRLPVESRVQFAEELEHQPKGAKEADVDRFIRRWRDEAEASAS